MLSLAALQVFKAHRRVVLTFWATLRIFLAIARTWDCFFFFVVCCCCFARCLVYFSNKNLPGIRSAPKDCSTVKRNSSATCYSMMWVLQLLLPSAYYLHAYTCVCVTNICASIFMNFPVSMPSILLSLSHFGFFSFFSYLIFLFSMVRAILGLLRFWRVKR